MLPAGRVGPSRRGFAGQRADRSRERRLRMRVVAFCRWAAMHGLALPEAAGRLGLSPRTLRRWRRWWERGRLAARGLGRPATRSGREERNRALALIGLLGPGAGVPTLQALCPGMARREVEDLLRRYRRAWRRRRRVPGCALEWTRPGAVWAADFAEPPAPVDGVYGRLLAVRDLASGCQLAWLPVEDESAETAAAALEALFREHGPPLVLKTDNGSAFIAGEVAALLESWEVRPLFSPPRTPRYNGSCEAGIGSMKARTHHQAARQGRPGEWTCDDAEAARLQANQTARPLGVLGPTPDEVWRGRAPITQEERAALAESVRVREDEAKAGQPASEQVPAAPSVPAAIRRAALVRALVDLGLLRIRRGFRAGD